MECLKAVNFQPYIGIGRVTFSPKNQSVDMDKRVEGKEKSSKGEGAKDRAGERLVSNTY